MNSVLSQDLTGIEILLIDNASEDISKEIANQISLSNTNVNLLISNEFLPVNKISQVALKQSLKLYDFEYFMFIGGDDFLMNENYLSLALNSFNKDPNLYGLVPSIVDQDGNFLNLKFSKYAFLNRIKLSLNWAYVHTVIGVYKKSVIQDLFSKTSKANLSISFDWFYTLCILKFKVIFSNQIKYFKYNKRIAYSSPHYIGENNNQSFYKTSNDELFNVKIKSHHINILIKWYRILFKIPISATNSHYKNNLEFLKTYFPIERFFIFFMFFISQLSKPIKFKFRQVLFLIKSYLK
jgi:hypothetical protein